MTPWFIPLLPLLALGLLMWVASVRLRNAGLADILWGVMFIAVAVTGYVLGEGHGPRRLLVLGLTTLWGARLSIHLARRNIGEPEDYRYREMREKGGPYWWLTHLVTVFWFQGVLAWAVSLPIMASMYLGERSPLSGLDALGVIVFGVGLTLETVADAELTNFRRDPRNKGRVLDRGLFRYTRHPNYFGDALVWWGLGLIGVSAGAVWSALGPILMTWLLMRVSGVALMERSIAERRPEYSRYKQSTNAFFPWFPGG